MSYTTEQPSSLDFEECCICNEEFSNDNDLAAHLLEHAADSAYSTEENNSEDLYSDSNVEIPVTPTKDPYPEYTSSNLLKPENSYPKSESPEVWEINSDDSGDEMTPLQHRTEPIITTPTKPMPQQRRPSRLLTSPSQNIGPSPQNAKMQSNRPPRPVGRPTIIGVSQAQKQFPRMSAPFKCNSCPSTFTDPKEFRDHVLIHEKQPFACNICNKTFSYKGSLRQHLQQHVGEQSHECPQCHKKFTMKSVLKKHCQDVHKILVQ